MPGASATRASTKMLVASVYKIPILVSLGAVAALLGASAIAPLVRHRLVRRSGLNCEAILNPTDGRIERS